jgi:tetratricopeptide (TPR) repeat protein
LREAVAAFQEALEIYRRQGNPAKAAIIIEFLGSVHERQGEYPAALAKYQEALALYQQYAPPEVARCERNIALLRNKISAA